MLLISLGGAAGTCARFALGSYLAEKYGIAFPWGTLAINVSGSFVIGVFLTAAAGDRMEIDPRWRKLVAVGFCGGFTTFSAFAYETMKLADSRGIAYALANVGGSVGGSLVAVVAGAMLARWLWL